jgi:hypothetical protein
MRKAVAMLGVPAFALAMAARALAYPSIEVPNLAPPLDPAAAPAWQSATSVKLTWDTTHGRAATEPASAWISTDGRFLYVRFEAPQREAIAAAQQTNDVGQGSDDAVWIDLWPNGTGGYFYQFQATPNGTHYESSSENTSYSPTWESHGVARGGGYTVTMKIPLDVIRGAAPGHPWKVQFVRYIHATGEYQVWSYDTSQTQPDDSARAGTMSLALLSVAPAKPKPRAAVYALGELASQSIGGSTSRVGADVSIPFTATASFYATFHPDYSNVELDQQSIAPTVTARYQSEVRPFFTQGANFYGQFNCDACPAIQELYTPAIPTPREGYAVEGKQGPIAFATFDALGDDGRSDIASALNYATGDQKLFATVQRVQVNTAAAVDNVTTSGVAWTDLKHLSAYFNYGSDSGTNVLVPDQAQRYDFGGGWSNTTFGVFGSARKLGEYYNPVDGFVSHPGIAGYALYMAKIFDFSANSKIASMGLAGFIDRYQGPTQGIAQSDNSLLLDVLTKSAWDLQLFSGSNYWRFGDVLTPVSQNAGFQLTYHSGLQTNNPGNFPYHGSSATPTSIAFNTGHYGDGVLDSWFRSTTIRIGVRGTLALSVNDTAQYLPAGPNNIQWFESASYTYALNSNASFSIGLRRVVGAPPVPNGGGDCVGTCSNVSIAYHQRLRHAELYLAYGNPNALVTVPQAIFKVIYYGGAEKGT